MWEHNDGCGESNILQNQFTAYLAKAIERKKYRYRQAKEKLQHSEISLEENLSELHIESDMLENFPAIDKLENFRLQCVLRKQQERNLHIFFARALYGRSFVEIAKDLKMDYKAVTAMYYRTVARIRKELRSDGK